MNKRKIAAVMIFTMIITNISANAGMLGDMVNKIKKVVSYAGEITVSSVPKTAEDIVTVCDCRQGLYNEEEVYLITYFMNGTVQKNPLVVEEDCIVSGIKSDMASISCGDMIIIDTQYDETVDFIRVVINIDDMDLKTDFNLQISAPERAAWYLYGTQNNAKNEVYFGYITNRDFEGEKCRITMTNHTGELVNSQVFYADEKTKVSIYNAYKKDEESRFEKADIYDIEASIFPSDMGDIDFESELFSKEDMRYAFIYIKRGEIKEITLVNYSK